MKKRLYRKAIAWMTAFAVAGALLPQNQFFQSEKTVTAAEEIVLQDSDIEDLYQAVSYQRGSVHDPSIIESGDGGYYVFGSHMGVAKTADLKNWTIPAISGEKVDNAYYGVRDAEGNVTKVSFNDAFKKGAYGKKEVTVADGSKVMVDFSTFPASDWNTAITTNPNDKNEVSNWTVGGNMWAPDIIYNKTMGKYCLYLSLNGNVWNTMIVLMTSDNIEGPYVYEAPIIYSGFTKSGVTSYKKMDLSLVLNNGTTLDTFPARYDGLISGVDSNGKATSGGHGSYGTYWPHAIDPFVLYDDAGELWMGYGSWSGGIYMIKLDEKTGLRDYTVTYPYKAGNTTLNESAKNANVTSDPYFGKKIAGGYYVSGEGAYVEKIGDYYFLFMSYGFYSPTGGYNMRIFRSKNIDGPYVDVNGVDAIYTSGGDNYRKDSRGLQLMGNYKWDTMPVAEVAQGHNSAYWEGENGNAYVIYHTKFADDTAGHQLRVHQLYTNEDGWIVAAPYEYAGEKDTTKTNVVPKDDIVGEYDLIVHQYSNPKAADTGTVAANMDIVTPVKITLKEDGTISGAYTGTWQQASGKAYATITIGGKEYKGVFAEQTIDGTNVKTMCFTAVNVSGQCIWGSKALRDDVIVAYNAKNIKADIPVNAFIGNVLDLNTEGHFGASYTWEPVDSNLINENGVIQSVEEDTNAEIRLTIKKGNCSYSKLITIKILSQESKYKLIPIDASSVLEEHNTKTESNAALPNSKVTKKTGLSFSFYADGVDSDWISILAATNEVEFGLATLTNRSADSWCNFYEAGSILSDYAIEQGYTLASVWTAFSDGNYYVTISFNTDGSISYYRDGQLILTYASDREHMGGELSCTVSDVASKAISCYKNGTLKFVYSSINNIVIGYAADYVLDYLYYEDYRISTNDSTGWTSPNAGSALTIGNDKQHGNYFHFITGSDSGNRGAYNNFFDADDDVVDGNYVVELDACLQSGNIADRSNSQLVITGNDSSWNIDEGIGENYILKLSTGVLSSSSRTKTWYINDTEEKVEIAYGEDKWVHIYAEIDTKNKKVYLVITDGATVLYKGTVAMTSKEGLKGLYILRGRGCGYTKIDNIGVYKVKKPEVIAEVGTGDYDVIAWNNYKEFYGTEVSGNFEIEYKFHNTSKQGAKVWENYIISLTKDLAKEAQTDGDWNLRADDYSISVFPGTTPSYENSYGSADLAKILQAADVTLTVTRVDKKITIKAVIEGSDGETYTRTAIAENCPSDDLKVYLGGENCHLEIYSCEVKKSAIAEVGNSNYDAIAWNNYAKFYGTEVSGDFEIEYEFHNSSKEGANVWENYLISLTKDLAKEAQTDGDWNLRADDYSISTFPGTTLSYENSYGSADLTKILKEADITLTVTRVDKKITIKAAIEGSDGKTYTRTAIAENCPSDDLKVYLGGENCHLKIYSCKVKKPVRISYVDEAGEQLKNPVEEFVVVGENYKIKSPSVPAYYPDKVYVHGTMENSAKTEIVTYKTYINQIGKDNGDETYTLAWDDYNNFYSQSVTGNFKETISFHNLSQGDENYRNFAVAFKDNSTGKLWYLRSDKYSNSTFNQNDAELEYTGSWCDNWDIYKDITKDSEMKLTAERQGNTMTVTVSVTGSNGTTYENTVKAKNCPESDLIMYLGGENCFLTIYGEREQKNVIIKYQDANGNVLKDSVTEKYAVGEEYQCKAPFIEGYEVQQNVISGVVGDDGAEVVFVYDKLLASVGTNNGDGTYAALPWYLYSNFYGFDVTGDFRADVHLKNYTPGTQPYKNYAVALTTRTDSVQQSGDGTDWYITSDKRSNGTFTGSTVDFTISDNWNWGAYPSIMEGADVTLHITREGTTITVISDIVGNDGNRYTMTATAIDCPKAPLKVFIGGEDCYLGIYDIQLCRDLVSDTGKYESSATLSAEVANSEKRAVSYQWYRSTEKITTENRDALIEGTLKDAVLISGEQGGSYKVTANDIGKYVAAVVTFTVNGVSWKTAASIPSSVTKAAPVYTLPTELSAVYGQTLSDVELPKGFAFEDPGETSVGLAGINSFTVSYTPDDTDSYEIVKGIEVEVTVAKSPNTPNMPNNSDPWNVSYDIKYVKDVTTLPEGWIWSEDDSEKALTVGSEVKATAVYNGEDKGNYETESVIIRIQRSDCTHADKEIRGKKEPTCTENGYSGDEYCTICEKLITGGTDIPAAGHNYAVTYANNVINAVCSEGDSTRKITLNVNGGTINNYTLGDISETEVITLPTADVITKESYVFQGWQTSDGTKYKELTLSEIAVLENDLTLDAIWKDSDAPTGTITIAESSWDHFLETITFGIYKPSQEIITIDAQDNEEIDAIRYLVATGGTTYTIEELKERPDEQWSLYDSNNKPKLIKNTKNVVYAKITDQEGNATYLSSDGMIEDETAPNITEFSLATGTLTETSVSFYAGANESGTAYVAVYEAVEDSLESASEEEIVAAVLAAAGEGTELSIEKGALISKTDLKRGTFYHAYLVVKDAAGNVSLHRMESFETAQEMLPITNAAVEGKSVYNELLEALGTVSAEDGEKLILNYQWYRSSKAVTDSTDLSELTVIGRANRGNYQIQKEDIGSYLAVMIEVAEEGYGGSILVSTEEPVQPKTVMVSATVGDKVYDGSAEVKEFELVPDGILERDDAVIAADSVAFTDANAGEDKTVLISGLKLSGEDASCYQLEQDSLEVTAAIQKSPNTPNLPDVSQTWNVSNSIETVGGVELPTDWRWSEEDSAKALTVGNIIKVTAVYNGADKGNYETESVIISMERAECTHEKTEVRNEKEATCTEKGNTGDVYCIICDKLIKGGASIPAKGHTEVIEKAVAPTCTEAGKTEGKKCSVCGVILVPQETIAPLGHNYASAVYANNVITVSCSEGDSEKKITLDTNGGTIGNGYTLGKLTEALLLPTADFITKTGYEFQKWQAEDGTSYAEIVLSELSSLADSLILEAVWGDNDAPTGVITIAESSWDRFLEEITFGIYKPSQEIITIEAEDNEGIGAIYYLIATDGTTYTMEELKAKSDGEWSLYDTSNQPKLAKDTKNVVYVKLTDQEGNTSYLSSDGIVEDETAPAIVELSIAKGTMTKDSVSFYAEANESGTAYLTVYEDTPELFQDMQDAEIIKKIIADAGEGVKLSEDNNAVIPKTGLKQGVPYIACLVMEDVAGHYSSSYAMECFEIPKNIIEIKDAKITGTGIYSELLEPSVLIDVEGGEGLNLEYQWYRSSEKITDTTNLADLTIIYRMNKGNYVPQKEDVGQYLAVSIGIAEEDCTGSAFAYMTSPVQPKTVTVSAAVEDKVYDRSTKAESLKLTVNGKLERDDVEAAAKSAVFEDANAGDNKTVHISGITLTGEKASCYQLKETEITAKASIKKSPNTPNISIASEVWNVSYEIEKVADAELPSNWKWSEEDAEKTLIPGNETEATAVYNGSDKGNYEIESVVIKLIRSACAHKEVVIDKAVEATCTEDGKTEGSHCGACNEILVAQKTVKAFGHDYASAVYADGVITVKCSRGDSNKKITFNTDGGNISSDYTINADDKIITLPTNDLITKAGYKFQGWEDSNGVSYLTISLPDLKDMEGDLELKALWAEQAALTGSITIDGSSWYKFLDVITFDTYQPSQKEIAIQSESEGQAVEIYYLIATDGVTYTIEELGAKTNEEWKLYDASNKPKLHKNTKNVVYAKLMNKEGSVAYLSSNGIIEDEIAPKITEFSTAIGTVTQNSASFNVGTNENGTAYLAVYENTPELFSGMEDDQIVEMIMSDAGEGVEVSAENNTLVSKTGLEKGLIYTACLVIQDEAGNISSYALQDFETPWEMVDIKDAKIVGSGIYKEMLEPLASVIVEDGKELALEYQWYRSSEKITEATSLSDLTMIDRMNKGIYIPQKEDVGQYLAVVIGIADEQYGGSAFIYTKEPIQPKTVTISAEVKDKIYDGDTKAEVSVLNVSGVLDQDDVAASAQSAVFEGADAGDNKTVHISGITLSGEDATGYQLDKTEITAVANIKKSPDTPNIPDASKVWNVSSEIKKVADVELPDGWIWDINDSEKTLQIGSEIEATAVYNGADKGNYATESVVIKLIGSECTHSKTEKRNAKEASCTEEGYTGDEYCTVCDELVKSGETAAALGHEYTSKVTKPATTMETGIKTYTCSRCGDTYTETIPKLDDTEQPPVVVTPPYIFPTPPANDSNTDNKPTEDPGVPENPGTTDDDHDSNQTDKPDSDQAGTTITTEDGTVVTTITEKTPDGTKETKKETKTDGTVKETITETKEDGSATSIEQTTTADKSAALVTVSETSTDGEISINSVIRTGIPDKADTVDIAESLLQDAARDDRINSIVVEITDTTINGAVSEKKQTVVNVNIPSVKGVDIEKVILTKDSIDTAKDTGKGLKVNVTMPHAHMEMLEEYTVAIPAKQLAKIDPDITEVNVTIIAEPVANVTDTVKKNKITKVVNQNKGKKKKTCVVSVAVNENVDAGMNVTIPVTKKTSIKKNNQVYVYKYGEKTGKLYETANCKQKVSKDGMVTIAAKSGTDYVISAKKLKGKKVETIVDNISIAVPKKTAKAGSKLDIKVEFPDTVSKKAQFGTEKAVISYRSDSPKIASVSKNGKITMKKKGKATITITVKLSSGQKVVKKQVVTVK